jgi:hypothetical protein
MESSEPSEPREQDVKRHTAEREKKKAKRKYFGQIN